MFSLLVVVALAAASNADPITRKANPIFPTGRIYGGEDAAIETYPYQVSLEFADRHECGGSIISANWILTAGHCVGGLMKYMTVRAGTSTKSKGGSVHQVAEVVLHERFYTSDDGIPANDIALVRVQEPFQFDTNRQPISLFEVDEEAKTGVSAVITGWGKARFSQTNQLQTVSLPIVAKEICNTAYETLGGLSEGQICAAYYGVGGKDTCQGDSGGPLAIDGRLAGVVSWGNGCGQAYWPGIYTEVAYFRGWINERVEL